MGVLSPVGSPQPKTPKRVRSPEEQGRDRADEGGGRGCPYGDLGSLDSAASSMARRYTSTVPWLLAV